MTIVPFDDASRIADEFIALIDSLGVSPAPSGKLEDELLSPLALLEFWRKPTLIDDPADQARILLAAAGVHDFAAKVLSARGLPEFSELVPHLKLFAEGKIKTSLTQNTVNDPSDDTSRKLSELYAACLAIHCGDGVRLDHPVHSKGDNPDVMLNYLGRRWALAIKTPSSRQGQSLFKNISDAARQIERCAADKGLVVINAKNLIDHAALWQPDRPFATVEDAIETLKADLLRSVEAPDETVDEGVRRAAEEWDAAFSGGKAVLPVLFVAQSVTAVRTASGISVPVPLKMLLCSSYDRPSDPDGEELAQCLNHWMQTLLRGVPPPNPQ